MTRSELRAVGGQDFNSMSAVVGDELCAILLCIIRNRNHVKTATMVGEGMTRTLCVRWTRAYVSTRPCNGVLTCLPFASFQCRVHWNSLNASAVSCIC